MTGTSCQRKILSRTSPTAPLSHRVCCLLGTHHLTMESHGASAIVKTIYPGVVLKQPWDFKGEEFNRLTARTIAVEPPILTLLGSHPRIVK